jgi:hypothetical protein
MQRLLNPPGSAYRSETGGLMEALRVLTVEQSTISIFWDHVAYLIFALYSSQLPQNILRPSELVADRDRQTFQWNVFSSESNPRTN